MKTPRELLLGRHEAQTAKLDELRREVLAGMRGEAERRPLLDALWQELILPVRQAWVGLGVAWAVILIMNVAAGDDGAGARLTTGPAAADSVMALRRTDWLQAQAEKAESHASPAQPADRRPRSEMAVKERMV